jgi:Flp pilus assembly protein CpaB
MRASTLVGLAIALFLGAVAVVAVRTSGIFNPTQVVATKEEPVMVLVARRNIFADTAATTADVMLRPATPEEIAFLANKDNRKKVLPANLEAASYRIANRHISVDELLKWEFFEDQSIPDSPTKRLAPGMRSVNVVVPKDRAASGLLRVGEYVDVFLTTTICTDPKCLSPRTATAPLAMHLKVVIKRDTIWTVMAPVPEDMPVSYILEANPYRAALIELAKTKGKITLIPTANNVKNPAVMAAMDDTSRVAAFLTGEASVTEQDLERIFNLKPYQTPEPPLAIEHYKGVEYVGTSVMDKTYGRNVPTRSAGYNFFVPITAGKANEDCPNCEKK